jgi:hypothetical protein
MDFDIRRILLTRGSERTASTSRSKSSNDTSTVVPRSSFRSNGAGGGGGEAADLPLDGIWDLRSSGKFPGARRAVAGGVEGRLGVGTLSRRACTRLRFDETGASVSVLRFPDNLVDGGVGRWVRARIR